MINNNQEAAAFGHDVGLEASRAVRDVGDRVYRYARRARWFDLGLLLLAAFLSCLGVQAWPVFAVFTCSGCLDLCLCWRLDPKRRKVARS